LEIWFEALKTSKMLTMSWRVSYAKESNATGQHLRQHSWPLVMPSLVLSCFSSFAALAAISGNQPSHLGWHNTGSELCVCMSSSGWTTKFVLITWGNCLGIQGLNLDLVQ
jgi:hypothetical protein